MIGLQQIDIKPAFSTLGQPPTSCCLKVVWPAVFVGKDKLFPPSTSALTGHAYQALNGWSACRFQVADSWTKQLERQQFLPSEAAGRK